MTDGDAKNARIRELLSHTVRNFPSVHAAQLEIELNEAKKALHA